MPTPVLKDGLTPMWHAIKNGNDEIAKKLISVGAELNTRDKVSDGRMFMLCEHGMVVWCGSCCWVREGLPGLRFWAVV